MNLELLSKFKIQAQLLVAIVPSGPCWHLIRLVGDTGVGRLG